MASVTLQLSLRQKAAIPMTPSKTLAQALNEFCAKFDLDPTEFNLLHNKKQLDLALAWRLSGISANATLEVKRSPNANKGGTSLNDSFERHSVFLSYSFI